LYLHMPYCRRKCPYCDFFKKVPQSGERERFADALSTELDLAARHHSWATGSPATVYFGGGTPSLHTADEIAFLLSRIRQVWGDYGEAEVTLETNPGTVDEIKLRAYRQAGVNRLSIGAQSFSSRKLAMLYRDHIADETRACVQMARHAGFTNLSLDLIFGLPGETLEEWRHDIYHALDMNPEHVSLYNLEFHPNTIFDRWKRAGRLSPLDEDLEAEMYLMTHELMTEHGFAHYEVSNFGRPGYESVHNSAYWKGRPYLGVGPSAHSYDGQRLRSENIADMHGYFGAIEEGHAPVARSEAVDEQTRREDWISLQLRQSAGILYEDAVRELGDEEARILWRRAAELPGDVCELKAGYLRLTSKGWFQENSVLLWLFATAKGDLTQPGTEAAFSRKKPGTSPQPFGE